MKQVVSFNTTPTAEKRLSPFIKKLWRIMNDRNLESIIHWSEHGSTICISNSILFCKSVLPHYFKHNNWHSFVRQLNLYGFRKVYHFSIAIDYASGRQETAWQFKHRHFQRDDEESLLLIQRKISSYPPTIPNDHQRFTPLMADIEKRLDSAEKQYESMKRETQSLRRQQQNQQQSLLMLLRQVLLVGESLYPTGSVQHPAYSICDSAGAGTVLQREMVFSRGDGDNCNSRRNSSGSSSTSTFHHDLSGNVNNNYSDGGGDGKNFSSGDGEMNDHLYSLPPLADVMSSLSRNK